MGVEEKTIPQFKKKEFDLKVEVNVTAFLRMEVKTNKKGAYALSQSGSTERIILAVRTENANSTKHQQELSLSVQMMMELIRINLGIIP